MWTKKREWQFYITTGPGQVHTPIATFLVSPMHPSKENGYLSGATSEMPSSSCTALAKSPFHPTWYWNPSIKSTSSSRSASSQAFMCVLHTPCTSQTSVRPPFFSVNLYTLLISITDTAGDTTSNTVSLALVAQASTTSAPEVTADASGGLTWWADAPTGVFRKGCDQTGKYAFTPLYALRRPIKRIRRFFRDKIRPEPSGDELSV